MPLKSIVMLGLMISFLALVFTGKVYANNKAVLQQTDISYLGHYDVPNELGNGSGLIWGQGFTHRYIGNQLRFLTFTFMGNEAQPQYQYRLIEFKAPSNFSDSVTSVTNYWDDVNNGTNNYQGKLVGIWWDEEAQRLWTTDAVDYPDDSYIYYTKAIHTRTLNNDGTVGDIHGPIGMEGIGARRIYGGSQKIPSWFQDRYGVGPYLVGWGGMQVG